MLTKNVWGQTKCVMGDVEMANLRNVCMQHFNDVNVTIFSLLQSREGALPYIGYIGMCRCDG